MVLERVLCLRLVKIFCLSFNRLGAVSKIMFVSFIVVLSELHAIIGLIGLRCSVVRLAAICSLTEVSMDALGS